MPPIAEIFGKSHPNSARASGISGFFYSWPEEAACTGQGLFLPGAVDGDAELLQVPLGKCCWLRICQAFPVGRLEVKNKQVCSMLNMPTSCHTNVQHG